MVTLSPLLTNAPRTDMPEVKTFSRQQKIGGLLGVALLAFAFGYRFVPPLFSGGEQAVPEVSGASQPAATAPMGFRQSAPDDSPRRVPASRMGPPISMASSEVITAYRRSINAPVSERLAEWLQHGDAAAANGKLAGSDASAASWYAKVLAADADNRAARAGLAEVARKLGSQAHAALADGNIAQARRLLEQLRIVPLADAEVARVQHALQVRAKVAPMLATAASLLEGDTINADARSRALALYRNVLGLAPDNQVAHQGLLKIQRYWLDQALAAVARNDYRGADSAVAHADGILPASLGLQNTRSRIEGMRRMRAGHLLAQARSALDSGELQLARDLADQALRISPDVPGLTAFDAAWRNARLYGGHQPGDTFSDSFLDRLGEGPTMVVLPIGSFLMGHADGGGDGLSAATPQHRVHIGEGIAMARTEVTVAQFREFVDASGYQTDAERKGQSRVYDRSTGRMHALDGADWRDDFAGGTASGNRPVVNISWNDAQAYANWLSERTGQRYRLPSEAEFEYAMRASSNTRYWWGDGPPNEPVENVTGERDQSRNGRTWVRAFPGYGDGFWGPAPVAHYRPNPFGLHDMNGNVSEWVADCWHDNYTRAPRDGSAWINPGCELRVVRGGSWGSAPDQVRSAYRLSARDTASGGRVGFRVVRELGGPVKVAAD